MADTSRQAERGAEQDPAAFGIGRLFWLMSEAIVGADLQSGTIVLWNPAAARLFGYSADEALGTPLARLVPLELRDRHLAGIERYQHGGEPALIGGPPVDVPAVTKSGATVDVALTLTDLRVEDDQGRHFVLALIRDMTAVRSAERALQQAVDAMNEFVATASHDLRGPLTTVMGFTNSLLEFGDRVSDEQRQEFLQAISRGATHASRLVDDLLTLSQVQAGALPSHPQDTPVADAAREAIARSGVPATCSVDDAVSVRVDPHHLQRILVNYLTNAARYGCEPIETTVPFLGASGFSVGSPGQAALG